MYFRHMVLIERNKPQVLSLRLFLWVQIQRVDRTAVLVQMRPPAAVMTYRVIRTGLHNIQCKKHIW